MKPSEDVHKPCWNASAFLVFMFLSFYRLDTISGSHGKSHHWYILDDTLVCRTKIATILEKGPDSVTWYQPYGNQI